MSSKYNFVSRYNNCLLDRKRIFQENRDKVVVYRWVNNIDGKTYVGSTVNFSSRFYKYYNMDYLKKHNTTIHNAILKYGLSSFSLEILEHCDKVNVIEREQYYFNLLKPEYNILQVAGSSLGFKHSEDTLNYFKQDRKLSSEAKEKLSLAASSRVFSAEERAKLSEIRTGYKMPDIVKEKISSSMACLIGVKVSLFDVETNTEKTYDSYTEAARVVGVSRTAVKKACLNGNLLKKRYYVKNKSV